ncbi:hypothetical protein HDU96_009283 [Phlyctochytrium bullatum]|nr:hypothetical protein HDU96_009283 [Phlyctochytrium bullatum]
MGNAFSGIDRRKLHGQTVVITGCDTGFGHETTLVLLSHGLDVVAGCFTEEGRKNLTRIKQENESLYKGKLTTLPLDVTSESSVADFAREIELIAPDGIYCLINNAGILDTGAIELLPFDVHRQIFDVNYFGALRTMQALLPSLRRRALVHPSPAPRLVNIASMAGRSICPTLSAYSASKHAVKALTEAARIELAPFGVKVVVVEPIFANTPMVTAIEALRRRVERNFGRMPAEARAAYGVEDGLVDQMMQHEREKVANFFTLKPGQVVDCIVHAVEVPKPEVRYVVGLSSYVVLFLQAVFPVFITDYITQKLFTFPATRRRIEADRRRAIEARAAV